MRQNNYQTASLGGWQEGRTHYCGGKVTQERMTDADQAKVTAKKEVKNVKWGGVGFVGVGRGRSRHPNFEGAETWAFGVDRYDDDNIRDGYTTTTNTTTTTTTATTTTTTTTTTAGRGGGCHFCSRHSKSMIRRTRMKRGSMTTKTTTIATAGQTTTIVKMKIMTLGKVDTYPPIERSRKRKRKKVPTRRSPPQQKTNTNPSLLPVSPPSPPMQMPPRNES